MAAKIYSIPYASPEGLQIYLKKTEKFQEAQRLADKVADTFQEVKEKYNEKKELKAKLDEKMRSTLRHGEKIDHEIKMQAKRYIRYIKMFDRLRSKIEGSFLKAQKLLEEAKIWQDEGIKCIGQRASICPEDVSIIEKCILESFNFSTKVISDLARILCYLNHFLSANQTSPTSSTDSDSLITSSGAGSSVDV